MHHRVLSLLLSLTMTWLVVACGSEEADDEADASMEVAEEVSADVQAPDDATDTTGGDTTPEEVEPPDYEPVVFAVVSDIHIDGPFESTTPQRVAGLFETVSALEPEPAFVAVTGDLIDQMPEPYETGEGSLFDSLEQCFAASSVPVRPVMGNHDYYVTGVAIFAVTTDYEARTQVYQDELGIEPFYYEEHGGMYFVYLDSMLDPSSGESIGLNGSMGQEQLDWLDTLLAEGVPSILFLHHPPLSVLETGDRTLADVIADHSDTVLGVFAGHIHVWAEADIAGVPVFLTKEGFHGESYQHVRVDPAAGTIEILNGDDIDYGETEIVPCVPDEAPPLSTPEALAGATMIASMPDGHIDPMGLGTYLREMMPQIPIALRLDDTQDGGDTLTGLITLGTFVDDGTDEAPPYMEAADGGPCEPVELTLDGPCFTSAPVDLLVDLSGMLGVPLFPGWQLRATLADVSLSGRLTDDGSVEDGVLYATIDFNQGKADVQDIIVMQYCNGKILDCKPGDGDLPLCPDEPDTAFFDEIPMTCDVDLLGVGLRTLFTIFESVPGLSVALDANFATYSVVESDEPVPGAISPTLFAPAPEGNCPAE